MTISTVEFYIDNGGGARWRLKASNGRIIATCGEGYSSKSKCVQGFETVQHAFWCDNHSIASAFHKRYLNGWKQ